MWNALPFPRSCNLCRATPSSSWILNILLSLLSMVTFLVETREPMLYSSPPCNHGARHTCFMHSAMPPRPPSSLWLATYARTRITTSRTPEPLLRIGPSIPARTIPYHTSCPVSWASLAGTTTQKYARGDSSAGAFPPPQRRKRHGAIITCWLSM